MKLRRIDVEKSVCERIVVYVWQHKSTQKTPKFYSEEFRLHGFRVYDMWHLYYVPFVNTTESDKVQHLYNTGEVRCIQYCLA